MQTSLPSKNTIECRKSNSLLFLMIIVAQKRCYYHPLKTTLNFTKFLKTKILVKSVFCQTSGQFTIVVVSKDWCQDFGAPLENICCLMAVEESQKMKL